MMHYVYRQQKEQMIVVGACGGRLQPILRTLGITVVTLGLVGGLPLATKITAGGRDYTLADLLAQARHDIRPGQECPWTLMALSAYLPPDATWEAGDGRRWTTEDVVRMEAESDIFGAACGGAHRLYGLAAAVAAYQALLAEVVS